MLFTVFIFVSFSKLNIPTFLQIKEVFNGFCALLKNED